MTAEQGRSIVRPRPDSNALPLSRREFKVVGLAADGLSARDNAQRIFRSPQTVENDRLEANTKLGEHN